MAKSREIRAFERQERKRLEGIARSQSYHIHLSKRESDEIIEAICPVCELYHFCVEYQDYSSEGHVRRMCILKSDVLESVWIEVNETRDKPSDIKPFDRFGYILVLEEGGLDSSGYPQFLCECILCRTPESRRTGYIRGSRLLSGKVTCCDPRRHRMIPPIKKKKRKLGSQKPGSIVYKEEFNKFGCALNHLTWKYQPETWQEIGLDGQRSWIYPHMAPVFEHYKCECGGTFRFDDCDLIVCDNEKCGLVENYREKIIFYDAKIDCKPIKPPDNVDDLVKSVTPGPWPNLPDGKPDVQDLKKMVKYHYVEHPDTSKPWPFTEKPLWWAGKWKVEAMNGIRSGLKSATDWSDFTGDQFGDD